MPITIKDIAKETGLGSATISAYLNNVPVRAYNKEKIENAIKKLGYIRNDYARGLKIHSSMTIGVLIPELSNIFATTIISEMEDVLRKKGYGIIVCDCKTDLELEQLSIKFLLSKMVDGLIIMPVSTDGDNLKIAIDNGKPVVVIDRLTDNKEVSHIVINNYQISYRTINEMIQKGYKNIGIITGDMSVYTAKERTKGYRTALEEHQIYNSNYVFNGGLTVDGGYKAVKEALEKYPEIEGFFATNYEMTVGCMIAINEAGRKIGKDLGFIGFDDVELSKALTPRIITINQPLKEIGYRAAAEIISLIAKNPPNNIVLEAERSKGESI